MTTEIVYIGENKLRQDTGKVQAPLRSKNKRPNLRVAIFWRQ